MSKLYPDSVGQNLEKVIYPKSKITNLKNILPNNTIIRIYGLANTGKSTISENICHLLDIPYVRGSYILRAATYIYKNMGFDKTEQNTDEVFNTINCVLENGDFVVYYRDKKLVRGDLKNSFIDTHITAYSSDEYIRQKYYEKLGNFLSNKIKSSCVLDSRGARPPYIIQAENSGSNVMQILLTVSNEKSFERYVKRELKNRLKLNPHYHSTHSEREALFEQFQKDILERNQDDLQIEINQGLGVVDSNGGVIDTSHMTVDEVIGATLNYIDKSI